VVRGSHRLQICDNDNDRCARPNSFFYLLDNNTLADANGAIARSYQAVLNEVSNGYWTSLKAKSPELFWSRSTEPDCEATTRR
jgi:hypothetical protein